MISCRFRSMPGPLRQVDGLVRGELGLKKGGSFLIPLRKLTEGTLSLIVLSDSRALTAV
jgi:hypothetical protein